MSVEQMRTTAQNFLTNKEKSAGGLFTAVCGIGTLLALWTVRSTILSMISFGITVVGGTIALGVAGLVGVWFLMTLMNPRTWTELRHLQYRTSAWVSSWAMKSDPFGRIRAYADEYLQSQWKKFNDAAVQLETQLANTRAQIEKAEETLKTSNGVVEALESRYYDRSAGVWQIEEKQNQFRLESQRIKQTELMRERRRKAENRMVVGVKILDRWRNTLKFEIESTRMTAQLLEEDFNATNAEGNALDAAASVVSRSDDMAKADAEARAYIEQKMNNRVAQSNVLLKQLPELTAIGDLKGDIAEDEIMSRLRALDSESQRVLVEVQEDRRLLAQGDPTTKVEAIKTKTAEPVRRKSYLK